MMAPDDLSSSHLAPENEEAGLLDHSAFPHIIDLVLSHPTCWVAFRRTSHEYHDYVNRLVFTHVQVKHAGSRGLQFASPYVPELSFILPPAWRHLSTEDRKRQQELSGLITSHAKVVDILNSIEAESELPLERALSPDFCSTGTLRVFSTEYRTPEAFRGTLVLHPPHPPGDPMGSEIRFKHVNKLIINILYTPKTGPVFQYSRQVYTGTANEVVCVFNNDSQPYSAIFDGEARGLSYRPGLWWYRLTDFVYNILDAGTRLQPPVDTQCTVLNFPDMAQQKNGVVQFSIDNFVSNLGSALFEDVDDERIRFRTLDKYRESVKPRDFELETQLFMVGWQLKSILTEQPGSTARKAANDGETVLPGCGSSSEE